MFASILLATSTALFVMATVHVALSFAQILQAFVGDEVMAIPKGSIVYWIDVAEPKMQVKEYLQMFSVCLPAVLSGSDV